jgi:hypothetical protein
LCELLGGDEEFADSGRDVTNAKSDDQPADNLKLFVYRYNPKGALLAGWHSDDAFEGPAYNRGRFLSCTKAPASA